MTRIDFRETALLRTRKIRHRLMRHAGVLGSVVALLWAVELLDWLWLGGALDGAGIQPRTWSGLQAIVVAPWLHAGFGHLLANTLPFVVLGWFVMMRRTSDFFIVTLASLLASGVGIWLFGSASSIHLGISGIVFGFLGYLLARGYYERSAVAVGLAILALLLYGSMMWGMLPLYSGISWQGHLFGFVGGVLAAYGQVQPQRNCAP